MTIEITSIDDLSSEDIENKRNELVAFVQEKYPTIDISRGVFSTLVLELAAIFGAKFEEELERWKNSRSMLAIEDDPTLAEDDTVDHIMSNYNVTRRSGAYASGKVALVFTKNISYILPVGYSFTCNGITFITDKSYAIYSTNSTPLDSDSLILETLKTGGYGCEVEVTASDTGTAGCIRKGTDLEIVSPITSLLKAYAAEDFTGGEDVETNAVMLNRFKTGMATPCWGNRYNIESLIRSETSHISDIAVVGCGDIEMTRDQLTLFPISVGGKTDIYIKTAPYSETVTVELDASLQSIYANTYTWNVLIPDNKLYGFWEITGIESVDEGVNGVLTEEINISTGDVNTEDCFFSIYQSRAITFTTEAIGTITTLYSTHKFKITLSGCPYIDEIQTLVESDDLKPVSSDVLVHAPVPCNVYATIHLNYGSSTELSDEQTLEIQTNIAKYINNIGFNQPLLVSDLIPIVQESLTSSQRVSGIQLDGIILTPTLKKKRVSSNQYIKIPYIPSEGVTAKITSYYTQLENISFAFNGEI